jgi:hypothetical protein
VRHGLPLLPSAGAAAAPDITAIMLSDPNAMSQDEFGSAGAISGNTLVVGAPDVDFDGNSNQGVAYVFVKSGSAWVQAAELIGSDGRPEDEFGAAVAIAVNGTVVVGAPDKDSGAGEAYVFLAPAGGWKPGTTVYSTSTILADSKPNNSFFNFGYSVAITGNGDYVVVGEPQYYFGYNPGTVYVYASPAWSLQASIHASKTPGDSFGYSVAVSGTTIVAGAPFANHAYSMQAPDLQPVELTPTGSADNYGKSVAISASGNTIVVGASYSDGAYVFTSASGLWSQVAELTPSDGSSSEFGTSVATIGSAVVVGAPDYTSSPYTSAGAVYLFEEPSSGWTNASGPAAYTGMTLQDYLGISLSMSGSTAIVGATGFNSFEGEAVVLSP